MSQSIPAVQARELLRWAFVEPGPGLDLGLVARLLGATAVEHRQLVADGHLEGSDAERVVVVRKGCSRERQRFTVAHEIGHLVVARGTFPPPPPDKLEAWCNQFAAELLAPWEWVESTYLNAPRTISTVRDLASGADVSLSMAATRLRDVCRWREVLIHWRRVANHWEYDWAVGLSRPHQRMLRHIGPRAALKDGSLRVTLRGEMGERLWCGDVHLARNSLFQLSTVQGLNLMAAIPRS